MTDKPEIGSTIIVEMVPGNRETGEVVSAIKTDPPTWTRVKLPGGQHRLARPEEIVNS